MRDLYGPCKKKLPGKADEIATSRAESEIKSVKIYILAVGINLNFKDAWQECKIILGRINTAEEFPLTEVKFPEE
jgi:hypothetical protein